METFTDAVGTAHTSKSLVGHVTPTACRCHQCRPKIERVLVCDGLVRFVRSRFVFCIRAGLGTVVCEVSRGCAQVVVARREQNILQWSRWSARPHQWLRPDCAFSAPCPVCDPSITLNGSGMLVQPARKDAEFRKLWIFFSA